MKLAKPVLAAEIEAVGGVATLKGLEGAFENIITVALGLAGLVVFLMLIVGGFRYITAGGDPKKVEGARRTLTYAIGGMVLVALAYLFLRFIAVFTGLRGILIFEVFKSN